MLGQRLEARLVLIVLCSAQERGDLVVQAAIGWSRHVLLLVLLWIRA